MKKVVGINLLIDIYNLEKKFLETNFLLDLLNNLIKKTKTIKVGKAIIKKISSTNYPYSGYSIVQIIKESHISIHTWPEYNYLAIDIFSCKKAIPNEILKFLKKFFGKKAKIKINRFKREINIKLT